MSLSLSIIVLSLLFIKSYNSALDVGIVALARLSHTPQITWFSYVNGSQVTINLKGPPNRWFGIGIGGTTMYNTYTIIVFPDGNVTEWRLGDDQPGDMLTPRFNITQNITKNGIREVELTRSRQGHSNLYYSFPDIDVPNVGIIAAWGEHPDDYFEYHGSSNYVSSTFNFLLANETTLDPTIAPTMSPTLAPTNAPSRAPTNAPTGAPTLAPTPAPTVEFENRYTLRGETQLGGDTFKGIDLVIGVDSYTKSIFITMEGPQAQWYAVGFGAKQMSGTYAIVVLWTKGDDEAWIIEDEDIAEYSLGNHAEGIPLDKMVEKRIQREPVDWRRNVLVERHAFNVHDKLHFNFSWNCSRSYDLIWARGTYDVYGPQRFAEHGPDDFGTGSINVEPFNGHDYIKACSHGLSVFKIDLYIMIGILFIQTFGLH